MARRRLPVPGLETVPRRRLRPSRRKVVDRYNQAVPDSTDGWVVQLTELAIQLRHQHHLDTGRLSAAVDVLHDELDTRRPSTRNRY